MYVSHDGSARFTKSFRMKRDPLEMSSCTSSILDSSVDVNINRREGRGRREGEEAGGGEG